MQQLGFVMGAQTTFAPRAHSFPAPWSTVPKVGDNAPSLSPHVSSSKIEPNGSVSCSEPKPNPGRLVSIVSDATPPLLTTKNGPQRLVSCQEPKPNPRRFVFIISKATPPPLLLSYSRISPS